ncbi:uncharacterized protein LOC123837369 isoform X3 [Mirounga angustirostris]|uniref:uncharacterized protein LOC123837369 isoform X3 n=1 Tax=Mirounga angustirostris TaxID=9716 RepID=UPI00313E47B6
MRISHVCTGGRADRGGRRPPHGPPRSARTEKRKVLLPSGDVVNVPSASFPHTCLYLHGPGICTRTGVFAFQTDSGVFHFGISFDARGPFTQEGHNHHHRHCQRAPGGRDAGQPPPAHPGRPAYGRDVWKPRAKPNSRAPPARTRRVRGMASCAVREMEIKRAKSAVENESALDAEERRARG